MELAYELGEVTPNYYEVQIRLACLDIQVQSMSVTVLIYRLVVNQPCSIIRIVYSTDIV